MGSLEWQRGRQRMIRGSVKESVHWGRRPNLAQALGTGFFRPVPCPGVRPRGYYPGQGFNVFGPSLQGMNRDLGLEFSRALAPRAYTCGILPWAEYGDLLAQRKPLLLFRLSGWFLLRLALRTLLGSLFHEPPRSTLRPGPTARRSTRRNCLTDLPLRPLPPRAQHAADLHDIAGDVLVLGKLEVLQFHTEPQVKAQFLQFHVRLAQHVAPGQ